MFASLSGAIFGTPLTFNESLITDAVSVAKGTRAFHSDATDLGGVLFLDPALTFKNGFSYFEVKVEVVRGGEEDGLTLGVTTNLPVSDLGLLPDCADDVDFSWSIGYDGRAHVHGHPELLLIPWNPKNVAKGDNVGFLVSQDGAACVLLNNQRVATLPGVVPTHQPLYGIVDLLGNCQGALLNQDAVPPASMKNFSIKTVREEVLEAMYGALGAQNLEKVKEHLTTAQHLAVDDSVLIAAKRAISALDASSGGGAKKDAAAVSAEVKASLEAITKAKQKLNMLSALGMPMLAGEVKKARQSGGNNKRSSNKTDNKTDKPADSGPSEAEKAAALAKMSAAERAKAEEEERQRKLDVLKNKLKDAMTVASTTKPVTDAELAKLNVAIDDAKKSGLDTKEAEALHKKLADEVKAANKAEEDLKNATGSSDAGLIQKTIDLCKSFGRSEAVKQAMDTVASKIQEALGSAKTMEKAQQKQQLPQIESMVGILRKDMHPMLRKLHNDVQDLKGALRVFCRIRPLNKREQQMNDTVAVEVKDQFTVSVNNGKETFDFGYDSLFSKDNTQDDVFEECKSLIQSCFDGYNVTIFTYGQTGAGKTWTLYGIPEQPGVSPRTCSYVFEVAERDKEKFEIELSASMIELYNSTIRDLLSSTKPPPKLEIKKEDKEDGSQAVKLDSIDVPCSNAQALIKAVEKGFGNRKVASTAMNADSSRSHLLFVIKVKIKDKVSGQLRTGKISIVDLAGSERLAKSQVTGDAQKEAIEINKSLTALGDVMMAITTRAKMIPYRNHKLTQLLQDSLGGTSKTLMFVNISPASNNADETICALKYASRARSIENDTKGGKLAAPQGSKASAGSKGRGASPRPGERPSKSK